MTDNEIIKALECHNGCRGSICEECPLFSTNECSAELSGYALDLINRQKAEIERLKLITTSNPYCVSIGTANIFTENHEEYEWLLAKISAEAIKEYIEKLKSKAYLENGVTGYQEMVVDVRDIDEIYDEMVGESNV
jgi:hypothetical protein